MNRNQQEMWVGDGAYESVSPISLIYSFNNISVPFTTFQHQVCKACSSKHHLLYALGFLQYLTPFRTLSSTLTRLMENRWEQTLSLGKHAESPMCLSSRMGFLCPPHKTHQHGACLYLNIFLQLSRANGTLEFSLDWFKLDIDVF